jgi:hypothetical protein
MKCFPNTQQNNCLFYLAYIVLTFRKSKTQMVQWYNGTLQLAETSLMSLCHDVIISAEAAVCPDIHPHS